MSTTPSAHWVPLESNPDVLTKSLGATKGRWVDVYGFDEEMLNIVPQPALALVLLFPITQSYDSFCKDQDDEIKKKGQIVVPDLYYMKQLIHNACGTIGVIHALANNTDSVELGDGMLKEFLATTKTLTPFGRGEALQKSDKLAEAHEEVSSEGQTEAPNSDVKLVTHFVTFVSKNNFLYELDGRREFPINHHKTTDETFLRDAGKICIERMKLLENAENPNEYRFSAVAYTIGDEDNGN